jgi:menaquinone-specific isochorismate synthase
MLTLPIDLSTNRSLEKLVLFLEECRLDARRQKASTLVSISLKVDGLDPLAVLESIFEAKERHFYVERPSEGIAIAGAEAVLTFTASGEDRFKKCQAFIESTLITAVSVGDINHSLSGPHFFCAFSFLNEAESADSFEASSVFVPRWQVGLEQGVTVAVANIVVDATSDVKAQAERLLKAHAKFGSFDYSQPDFKTDRVTHVEVSDVNSEEAYKSAVRQSIKNIKHGAFEKIVLARAKDFKSNNDFHPLRILNGLRQRFTQCYAFSVANENGLSFIGASPERLIKCDKDKFYTEALAGSIKRGATASEDAFLASFLQKDDKELREHAIVADTICSHLVGLGLVVSRADKPSIHRYTHVQHLHTPIEAKRVPSVSVFDILQKLHPTPAVGGMPRDIAISQIRLLEGFSRGLYAGAIGYVNATGEGEFFVGLRSALVEQNRARAYAGSGIVAGSSEENEFNEIELKFKAMQEALLS